jgi:hypothetical protein
MISEAKVYCKECGAHRPVPQENYCNNPSCIACIEKQHLSEDIKYCEDCGKPTSLWEKSHELFYAPEL